MIDLNDIEARIAEGIYGDDRLHGAARNDAFSALAEIIAEVKRLRAERDAFLRACVPPTHPRDYGYEAWEERLRAEVAAERAAVVAWLRFAYLRGAADAIERGEHRRGDERP